MLIQEGCRDIDFYDTTAEITPYELDAARTAERTCSHFSWS